MRMITSAGFARGGLSAIFVSKHLLLIVVGDGAGIAFNLDQVFGCWIQD